MQGLKSSLKAKLFDAKKIVGDVILKDSSVFVAILRQIIHLNEAKERKQIRRQFRQHGTYRQRTELKNYSLVKNGKCSGIRARGPIEPGVVFPRSINTVGYAHTVMIAKLRAETMSPSTWKRLTKGDWKFTGTPSISINNRTRS